MRKKLVEAECCTNKRCYICAGLNRKLVFVLVNKGSNSEPKSLRGRRTDHLERGRPLSEHALKVLHELLKIPGARLKLIEICNLSKKTIDNAAKGNKMFAKTRVTIEEAIERLEGYVRTFEELREGYSERPSKGEASES